MAAKKKNPAPCRLADCFAKATHRGLCPMHYSRLRRTGSVAYVPMGEAVSAGKKRANAAKRRPTTGVKRIARDPVIALYRAEKRRKIKRDAVKIRHAKVEFERMLAATSGFCGRPRKEAR